jgi:hypothetical protein
VIPKKVRQSALEEARGPLSNSATPLPHFGVSATLLLSNPSVREIFKEPHRILGCVLVGGHGTRTRSC